MKRHITCPTRSGNSKHCTIKSRSPSRNASNIFRFCVTVHSMSSQNICSVANPSEIAHVSICQPSVLYKPYCLTRSGAHFAGVEILNLGGKLRGSKLKVEL